MKTSNLKNMKFGWFIGNFEPSLFKTNNFEVAVKEYKQGDKEKNHYHKIATEYTVIVTGKVKMNNNKYSQGDIIITEVNEVTNFEALEDSITTVVKVPSATNDKYVS